MPHNIAFKFMLPLFLLINVNALELNSGESRVQFIELFTSQSCSSCPPAEKWINKFEGSGRLWKRFVPVEFHVDYWNHLNWKDRFSKKEYTARQRQYNQVLESGVFTPQIVLNGKNYNGWRFLNYNIDLVKQVGNLNVKYSHVSQSAKLVFTPLTNHNDLNCFSAYLGGGLKTKIQSGENRGKKANHEFTVLNFNNSNMIKVKGKYTCNLKVELNSKIIPLKKALAFWIVNIKTLEVVQATGTYIN